ncbi:DeoR/GlpR family DNA-binding transcription regulator [Rhizobium leguminosarum]|uniref:DeoR/GlpR family DNA-binding transcription regulator n=1 Tax=Rhizobium leguminosarum TaxID=384 RepID=UPI001AE962AB|nr:DeoR/GlpR family DNA-binding transcription regulator [Rhizobium leguminosarum]MBP2448450.1 DeoR/GlpR family transcriptional regulator of sugar metabolism [Rhizobium leguminosarum]
MSASQKRKTHILQTISAEETITVADLAASLDVSEMTIRRDLSELEKEGLLKRVHGGAVSSHGRSYEPPFTLRRDQATDAKRRIAEVAASMVEEGDSLALDVGSTVLELAKQLSKRRGLTIVTPSVRILNHFINNKDIRLIVTGGILRNGEESLVGDLAAQAFRGLFVDKLFLGVGGLDAQNGLTEYNWDDALVKRAMIGSAKEVILLIDSSKFGRSAFAKIAELRDIHVVVTDVRPPPELLQKLEENKVRVIVADGHSEGNED